MAVRQVRKVIRILLCISVLVLLGAVLLMKIRRPYNETLVIEAGSRLFSPAYFFKNLDDGASYVTKEEDIDLKHVGSNAIKVKLNGQIYNVTLEVVDTTPPAVTAKDSFNIWSGQVLMPYDFVKEYHDATDVTFSFKNEPDFVNEGEHTALVTARDEGGNETDIAVSYTVIKDTTPPSIYGARDRIVKLNSTVSYRDEVYVTDDIDTDVVLQIDSSNMNIRREGVYEVKYYAVDSSGNYTEKTVNFTVVDSADEPVAQSVIDEAFNAIYSEIINDGMTKREKAYAIYNYVSENISYIPVSDKSDWEQNAYKGITTKQGDCYTYYAVSRKLLTMADIETMCVKRDNENFPHYWNLINCGDGWYHFDTCPRGQYSYIKIFMYTDEQMRQYSANISEGYYDFDSTLYPATP